MVEKVLGSWNPFQIFQELKVFINFDPQKKIEYFYFLAFLSIRKSRCGKNVRQSSKNVRQFSKNVRQFSTDSHYRIHPLDALIESMPAVAG